MSEYGWLSKCQLPTKNGNKKITGVSDSSMMGLRAVIAARSREREADKLGKGNHGVKKKHINVGDHDDSKRKRIEKDELIHREERRRKHLKNVTASLTKKANLYDKLASGDMSISNNSEDDWLVDFSRKKRFENEKYEDDTINERLVTIEDEFGRSKIVKEDSSGYRFYIAEQSRIRREEEMRSMPGFGLSVDPYHNNTATQVVQKVYQEKVIPFGNNTIRDDFRPMDTMAKNEVNKIHAKVEEERQNKRHERSSKKRILSAKEKKLARLELIKSKLQKGENKR